MEPNVQPNMQSEQQAAPSRAPMTVAMRVMHLIAFTIFPLSIPSVLYLIGIAGDDPAIQTVAAALPFLVICAGLLYSLICCRRPVYLIGAVICTLFCAGVAPGFGACGAALICGSVAGGALMADLPAKHLWLPGAAFAIALGASFALTGTSLLCALTLLPLLGAVALGICQRKKYSLIVSTGSMTGALAAGLILYLLALGVSSGMPLTVDGIREALAASRASLTETFVTTLDAMLEMPEFAEQYTAIFGEALDTEALREVAGVYGAMALNLMPGLIGALLWCISFVSVKGAIATLYRKTPRTAYPAHAARFIPSLPTAIFYLLCLGGSMITLFFPITEMVFFILLNIVLILLPMMTLTGILDVLSSFRRPHGRFATVALWVVALLFLGIWVLPVISITGAFSIISRAIYKALEQKLNSYKGDQQ